jgi:UDP-N-acetylglucosamine--N-acetylmuramyl-(pentapeptide) pyrophosphoryl-undecaprenol N-acetylglucosamine transferase
VKLLLAAGGTGGHVFPALALAEVAREAGHDAALLGGADGLEARLAAEADVAFVGVATGKWDRQRPDPRQAWRAVRGLGAAASAVRRMRPDVVVGFGGFASFPGCVAAVLTRTPLLLHEGNAFPGRVVRWFAGRAAAVALAFPEAAARLPRARRTETVGYPVRERRLRRGEARRRLGLPAEGPVTLVMGGSQGARALNEAAPTVFRTLPPERRGTVLHATGPRWLEEVRAATADLPGYRCEGFVDAVAAWSAVDLAWVRAGVGTLSEAAYHGVPLIMSPLPTSADDHQRHNARAVDAAGAGRAVEQDDLAGLARAWTELLDADAREAASTRIAARSPAGAAARLLALAEEVAGGRNGATPSLRSGGSRRTGDHAPRREGER